LVELNKEMNNKKQLFLLAFILFNLFGFKYFEPYLVPPVQSWIMSSGPMAGVYYSIAGLASVVVAPITLGPIHVILQKSFGFWTSFGLFYCFTTVGQLINFLLAKKYGEQIVNRFFPELSKNSFYGWLRQNLDRSIPDIMLINVGLGGDFLAYLFGLSNVKFYKFATVVVFVNLFSSFVIVSRNIAVGDTSNYLFWLISSYIITYLPLLIVFRKDLPQFWQRIKKTTYESQQAQNNFERAKKDFANGKITQTDFDSAKTKAKSRSENPFSGLFADKMD
jgi:uncharacterized membrane protein YdjX (TVP38/TMEM64 family)